MKINMFVLVLTENDLAKGCCRMMCEKERNSRHERGGDGLEE